MGRGKKIETIKLRKDGAEIGVPLKMHTARDGSLFFTAEIEELDIRIKNVDANVVRAELHKAYEAAASITWTPWLLVVAGGKLSGLYYENTYRGYDTVELRNEAYAKVRLKVKRLWIGRDALGNDFYCERYSDDELSKHNVRPKLPETGSVNFESLHSGRHGYNDDAQACLIPETPETLNLLDELLKNFDQLRQNFAALFSPDEIATTLVKLSCQSVSLDPFNPDNTTNQVSFDNLSR